MQIAWTRFLAPMALAAALVAAPAAAQQNNPPPNDEHNGIGIGAELGVVHNSLSGAANNLTGGTGEMFGLWVGGNRGGNVGFVGEFVYLVKKATVTGSNPPVTANFHSLEIPAVFHINFGSHNHNKPGGYVVVGPVFTINVQKSLSAGLTGSNFSSADIGLLGGGGFEVYRIGVEVRGNWGFRSINASNGGNVASVKSHAVEILAKIRFN